MQPEERVEEIRNRILQDFERNFPHLKFDPDLLSLIEADYTPESVPEEDKHLVMDYLEGKAKEKR